MTKARQFEDKIGGRWTGISFHTNGVPEKYLAETPMRLCEAITKSSTGPITLTPDLINCPGALRSLGWKTNDDKKIAHKIAEATGTDPDLVRRLIKNTPCIHEKIDAVTLGTYNSPDLVVSYIQPIAAMKFVRKWQQKYGTELDIPVSSLMAVCGSVVARASVTNKVCLSFGCPDSREYGAIGNDRLAIGFPVGLIDELL